MRKFGLFVAVVLVLMLLALPVMAQDALAADGASPAPTEVPPEYPVFMANLLALLTDFTAIPALAAGVLIFTNAIKAALAVFKVPIDGRRAVLLALGVQVFVWIVYQLAVRGGFDLQFRQWYDAAATIIQTLLPLVLTLLAAPYAYDHLRDNPVLGYGGYKATTPDGAESVPKG